jgi:hypothetical protein
MFLPLIDLSGSNKQPKELVHMEYKAVKNPGKPGRPPSGCVWVKDDEGNLQTNAKGEVAFRKATAADLKKKKKSAKKKTSAKRGRKAAPAIGEDLKPALLLKKTYKDLSSDELEKVKTIVGSMIDSAKKAEREKIEKQIDKLKSKLGDLK